jgi:predicted GNAT superfamily acetyltransferase
MSGELVIRDLTTIEELRTVEDLQREVWQFGDLDVVPVGQLIATVTAGGILVGAFDGPRMVGFAYAFGGVENGHWHMHSHMAAVLDEYQNRHVGLQLKLAQKQKALERGVDTIQWTFDPLQARNAHFNFARLGVYCDRYFVNFYGDETSSFLHSIGTDRFLATWPLREPWTPPALTAAPLALEVGPNDEPCFSEDPVAGAAFRVQIPRDINAVMKGDAAKARTWREATRRLFESSIGRYRVATFERETSSYLLIPRPKEA